MRRTVGIACLALAGAASASAHSTGTHVGFVSTVSGIHPPQPGLLVRILGGHERVSVQNLTQKRVVVFGADGRAVARLAPGEAAAWPDPRIEPAGPPPQRERLVRNWRIRGEADGDPFEIRGFLGYRPPAEAARGTGLPAWALALLGAGAAAAVAALALPLARGRARAGPTTEPPGSA